MKVLGWGLRSFVFVALLTDLFGIIWYFFVGLFSWSGWAFLEFCG